MLKDKMQAALNDQVNAELYSAYLYLSMSAYFESENLSGAAHWMRIQAQEELGHAMKIHDFIIEREGLAELKAIEAPPTKWDGPLAVFKEAYQHEQKVTGLINDLVDLSLDERDHATNIFLQWFVTEQIEEEANASAIVQDLEMVGSDKNGLLMLDRELAQRMPPPAPGTETTTA